MAMTGCYGKFNFEIFQMEKSFKDIEMIVSWAKVDIFRVSGWRSCQSFLQSWKSTGACKQKNSRVGDRNGGIQKEST